MMKIVIFNEDGTCSILTPFIDMFNPASATYKLLLSSGIDLSTDEKIWEHIIKQAKIEDKNYRFVEEDRIPSDRSFRNAWTHVLDTDTVDVDIDKAKEIHKDTLRALRKPILEKLDIEYMIALEQGNIELQAEIKENKQELRDVTDLDMPNTPEELKDFIPEILL